MDVNNFHLPLLPEKADKAFFDSTVDQIDAAKEFLKMKIILQNTRSDLYFGGPGVWTSSWEEAIGFETSDAAIESALEHRLTDVHVVLKAAKARSEAVVSFLPTLREEADAVEKTYSFRKVISA
jgi:hypothetical protein